MKKEKSLKILSIVVSWIITLLYSIFASLLIQNSQNNLSNNYQQQETVTQKQKVDLKAETPTLQSEAELQIRLEQANWLGFFNETNQSPPEIYLFWNAASIRSSMTVATYIIPKDALQDPSFSVFNDSLYYRSIPIASQTYYYINSSDWTVGSNKVDWNDPNYEVEIIIGVFMSSIGKWTYLSLGDTAANTYFYKTNDFYSNTWTVGPVSPIWFGINHNMLKNGRIKISFGFGLNSATSAVYVIKANDEVVFNRTQRKSGSSNYIFNPPLGNTAYTFTFYIDDVLFPEHTFSVTSMIENATYKEGLAFEDKPNYQVLGSSEPNNGVAGASASINNPSNLALLKVEFTLMDNNQQVLAVKNGTATVEDPNTYEVIFDDTPLGSGTYIISVLFDFDPNIPNDATQDNIFKTLNSFNITNIVVEEPQFSILAMNALVHPYFRSGFSNWDNGSILINYSLEAISEENTIISANYELHKVGEELALKSGSLIGNSSLLFGNLTSGNYYITWTLEWQINALSSVNIKNGQSSNITLTDISSDIPSVTNYNIDSTKYQGDNDKAIISGFIQLTDYYDAIGNTLQVTPYVNDIAEPSHNLIINENGVIYFDNWEINYYGDYRFELSILDYKITSSQISPDYNLSNMNHTIIRDIKAEGSDVNIVLDSNDDFAITFNYMRNDGAGKVVIKANGIEFYNQNLSIDGIYQATYEPPAEYTDYTFDFYFDGDYIANLSQTHKSNFTLANVETSSAFQVKANYQPTGYTIGANGLAGANILINNTSNIAVENVVFTLKNSSGQVLATKNGIITPNNLNSYIVSFSDQHLGAGNYIIDYQINFNSNPLLGKWQDPIFVEGLNVTIVTEIVANPQLNFNSLEAVLHPSFAEGNSDWTNGKITVGYTLEQVDNRNQIQSATYNLYLLGQESPLKSGSLVNGTNLTFNNLSAGTYYISWTLTWNLGVGTDNIVENGDTNQVTLVDINQDIVSFSQHDITTTKYYDETNKGKISGTINLANFSDAVNKILRITPEINGVNEIYRDYTIPNDGIITLDPWTLNTFGAYNLHLEILNYKVDSTQQANDFLVGTINSLNILVYQPPQLTNFSLTNNEDNNIVGTFDLTINDGPGNIVISTSGFEVFNQTLVNDGSYTFVFNPPLEYTNYTFNIYLNGVLLNNIEDTILSAYQNATITNAFATQVKKDYQPSEGQITHNGQVGANVTIDNPSDIEITSVTFNLKDDQENLISTKNGIINTENPNIYEVLFDDAQLASGNYIIDYQINFNLDPEQGPIQSQLVGTLNINVETFSVSIPTLNISNFNVVNHPTFDVSNGSIWNNGSINIDYLLSVTNPLNTLLSATYELYQVGVSAPKASGSLTNNVNLIFDGLIAGSYYLAWNFTWSIEGEEGTLSKNGVLPTVVLTDVNQEEINIFSSSINVTKYYSAEQKAIANGVIILNNYRDAIGNQIEVTPIVNGQRENSKILTIPSFGALNINNWELDTFGEYTFEFKVLDYKINSSQVEEDYLIGQSDRFNVEIYNQPILSNYNITFDADDNIAITFNFDLNDGPGEIMLKANGTEFYASSITADEQKTIIFTPPLEYTDYTFQLYLNNVLQGDLTQTVRSKFANASVTNAIAWEVKANFQTTIGNIENNGIVGASLTIDNPSEIAINQINFILKDELNNILYTQEGVVSSSDLNSYQAIFDDASLNLDSGNYKIEYQISFNEDSNLGKYQSILSDILNVTLTTEQVDNPQVNFNSLIVSTHPYFESNTNPWNNGQAEVHYSINMIDDSNAFTNASYNLFKEGEANPIATGTLNAGNNTLIFNNLSQGVYYISSTLNYQVSNVDADPIVTTTNNVTLIDWNQDQVSISVNQLVSTPYYSNIRKGTLVGDIMLNHYENAIGKELQISAIVHEQVEDFRNYTIPADGIIHVNTWTLNTFGVYKLTFKVLDYQINSIQNNSDYVMNFNIDYEIAKHTFNAPNIAVDVYHTPNNESLILHFTSDASNKENPWLDIENFEATLTINYFDGTIQTINFNQNWLNSLWNMKYPIAIFEFPLDKIDPIESISIAADFENTYMPTSRRSLNVMRSVDSVSYPIVTKDKETSNSNQIIWIIVVVPLIFGSGALLLPIIDKLISKKY